MERQLFVGLITEGNTDMRFLNGVVKRTFDEIGFECHSEVEIVVVPLPFKEAGQSFTERMLYSSKKGLEQFGIMVLCIHVDADGPNDDKAYRNKVLPAKNVIDGKSEDEYCKILATLIPVQMIEAWLLADKELFKKEIGTDKRDSDLGIHRQPEHIAKPKELISEAIRISREGLTRRRRRNLTISDLYLPLGQKISIDSLERLESFRKFKDSIRDSFRELNFLK